MGLLAKKMHPMRRKSDIEAWEHMVDDIALSLCPVEEVEAYRQRQKELARHGGGGQVKCFPVWRKYRPQALKVAHLQRTLPVLKRLPLRMLHILSELIYK